MLKPSTFFICLLSFLIFATQTFSQNLSVIQNQKAGGSPNSTEALVTINYDGANAGNSVGDGGTTFIGGARFTPAIMGPLTGGELQFVQFYYSQAATGLTIKVYDAGTATDPGALLVDQPLNLALLMVDGWNEVELSTYVPISGNDLWICLEVEDATTTAFPFGVDAGPADPNGDFVNDSGVWQHLAGFGLNFNWNIRGVVEDSPVGGIITIAQAIEDLNNDFVPDRLGDTVTVQGVVFSPNYQTTNNSYYIYDGTAGTDIFMYSPPLYTWAMGDELKVTGVVTQYNGMSEIIPVDSTGWELISTGNPTPDPIVLTLGQFLANAEAYEGSLVGFISLSLVGGTWPASGSTNLSLSDGVDTVVFRIDSDTDIDGSPEPAWPVDVVGIGSQFDNSAPYSSGYQVFPRFYASDFLPAGSLPVELTSFAASVVGNSVNLNWSTATELNNSGFEVQRKITENGFITIGFIKGNGTTTQTKNYSYIDENLVSGTYSYRLKQVDFDGSYSYSKVVETEVVTPTKFELSQNYPNPFNPSTSIKFSLPESGIVKLAVYNLLGQEVKTLVNGFKAAGSYSINFDASNLSSGLYLYKIEVNSITQTKKMTLIK